jgi:hypothetical protein
MLILMNTGATKREVETAKTAVEVTRAAEAGNVA